MTSDEIEAQRAGIDSKANVRAALIAWRDAAMTNPSPHWDGITLLSHAIWWLADDDE